MIHTQKAVFATFAVFPIVLAAVLSTGGVALADVFPNENIGQSSDNGSNRYNGVKRSLYFVVHDDDSGPDQAALDAHTATVQSNETAMRNFFAENSGGRFDIYLDVIVDAAIPLNPDGTRPSNWETLAKNVATGPGYNLNLNDYYMFAYDVNFTVNDPDDNFSGRSIGDRIYLHSTSGRTLRHEVGHRIDPTSNDHGTGIRQLDNDDVHPYYWDRLNQEYRPYTPSSSPINPVPFGSQRDGYGNIFDTMGDGNGDLRLETKYRHLGWLTSSQVPNLNNLGEGTYRIYAHDELQSTTKAPDDPSDPNDLVYGATEDYNPNVYYGLTYTRQGQQFNTTTEDWDNDTQTINIEYRSGENGVMIYLDDTLLDMDSDGDGSYFNQQRLLKIGKATEDIDFGMSTYIFNAVTELAGVDFLSFNPPPPTILANSWYHFNVLNTGSDAIGDYIELAVSLVEPLNDVDGDLNQDGELNDTDVDLFIARWLTDTSSMTSYEKYRHGDIDLNGVTDLADAFWMHQYLAAQGSGGFNFSLLGVPEPGTLSLLAVGLVGLAGLRRRRP